MSYRLVVPDEPTPAHREGVRGPLAAFNADHGYPVDTRPLAVLLLNADGDQAGGLWGQTALTWLYVEFLLVPAPARGGDLGTRLMDAAETLAHERGCRNAWLTTFSFQARTFYEKRGYVLFGELDQSPADNVRYFLRKAL